MKIGILGIGNVLMGDDGIGPLVVKRLEAFWDLGENVELIDGGTPGPELLHLLADFDALILVDALRADGPAGEIRTYRRDELLTPGARGVRVTPHEPSLRDALETASLLGGGPREVFMVGVLPLYVGVGTELSPPVEAALGNVEEQVLRELRRLGAEPSPRAVPSEPEVWWRAAAR